MIVLPAARTRVPVPLPVALLFPLLTHSFPRRSKLFWYSIIESLVVVGISVGQVWLVRSMFEKGSTRRYRV